MGLVWQRIVEVKDDGDGEYLEVRKLPEPSGGNPPGREDGPEEITIYPEDRKPDAKVIYTLIGSHGTLGCEDKGPRPAGFEDASAGNTLTITDKESAPVNVTFSYYVTLGDITTKDPQIHNPAGPRN